MSGADAQRAARRGPAARLAGLSLAAALAASGAARADGAGLLVGEAARLHFSLDLESRYDSLAGQGAIGTTANNAVDPADVLLHLRPGVRLSAPGAKVDFDASAGLDWTRYSGWLAPTTSLSYLGATAGAALEIGKGGPVGLRVTEAFSRSDRTTNPAIALGTITNSNALGARLAVRPGGGAIEGAVSYDFGLEAYTAYKDTNSGLPCPAGDPTCDPSAYAGLGSQTHRFGLDARWKFLPKTALILDASWALRFYESSANNVPSKPLRIQAGLAGLISEKLRVVLEAGWEKTYLDTPAATSTLAKPWPQEASAVIGRLEVGWNPTETAGVTAGAQRTLEPVSANLGWYDDLRGYLSGKLALGGRVQLTAAAHLDRIDYGNGARTDTTAGFDAAADVEIVRLLHAVAGLALTTRDSTQGGVYVFQRTELFLRLVLAY